MRASTVFSLAVALVLAVLAVIGVRSWVEAERASIARGAGDTIARNYIVIASADFAFGDRITADRVELMEWASDRLPEGAFVDIPSLVGTGEEDARYALSSIKAGEMILPTKLTIPGQRAKLSTSITPGMRALSIRVNDVLGVAGFVLPGDRVDVMLTRDEGNGPFVDVLLQGVRVVAIDQTADDRTDQPSVVQTVTFEVTGDEAQKLTLAATIGTLSLSLRNIGADEMQKTNRVSVVDLNAADSSARQETAAAPAAEASSENTEEDDRVAKLEAELAALRDGAAAAAAAPVEETPDFANVGVIRGGQRAEYRVLMFLGQ